MEKQIQAMTTHWMKLLICVFTLFNTQVYSYNIERVNITLVNNAAQKGAVCLDGSPAGYHYVPGYGEGANNWLVYIMGGGWCGSKSECLLRVGTAIGSTNNITGTYFSGILIGDQTVNPDFYNWNRVYLRYCDGSSFMGDVEAVDPESNLHRRGLRIFKAIMDELLAKGMKQANNAILVGNSAGGLTTILHCDRFRALIPNASRVKCISDSGFFIRAKDLPGLKERDSVYERVVAYHGVDPKSLPASCTSRMDPSLCFYPENVVGNMQTPLFLLNSVFDQYQLHYNLKDPDDPQGWEKCTGPNTTYCTRAHFQHMKGFRNAFLQTLKDIGDSPLRGLFINSCYIHDFLYKLVNWNQTPILGNKNIAKAIGDWYFDRSLVQEIDTQHDYPVDCNKA